MAKKLPKFTSQYLSVYTRHRQDLVQRQIHKSLWPTEVYGCETEFLDMGDRYLFKEIKTAIKYAHYDVPEAVQKAVQREFD